jgi:hypothetical protein
MKKRWKTGDEIARWHCLYYYGELISAYPSFKPRKDKLKKYNLRYSSMLILDRKSLVSVHVSISPIGYMLIDLKKQKVVKATPRWSLIKKVAKYQKEFLKRIRKWWRL